MGPAPKPFEVHPSHWMAVAQSHRNGAGNRRRPSPRSPTSRATELRLLLATLPLACLGWLAAAMPRDDVQAAGLALAPAFGMVVGGAFLVHLLFRAVRFDGDALLLPLLTTLLVIGTTYHAGLGPLDGAEGSLGSYRRAALVALGTVGAVVALAPLYRRLSFWVEERIWWRLAGPVPYYESIPFLLGLGAVLVALVGLLLLRGRPTGTSGAIIQAPLFGGWTFTPSEFVRLAIAFFLADYLGRNSRILRNLRQPLGQKWPMRLLTIEHAVTLGILLGVIGLYCLFFFVFRDYGPAVILYALAVLSLWAATGRMQTPAAMVLAAVAIVWLAGQVGGGGTLQHRLAMWLHPWDTDFRYGDHQARILWSMVSGGWLGMPTETGLTRHLPEADRDAAFAGLIAHHGLWVGLALLGLFATLTARGFAIAGAAATDRSRLLAFSLTLLLALQAIWICGAMVGAFPFSGINLPFISTGTSSALASAIALGAVLNVSRGDAAERDPGEATEAVAKGIRQLGWWAQIAYLAPALCLVSLAPAIRGDALLVRSARAVGEDGEAFIFRNPYLEAFIRRLPRGRLWSTDGVILAQTEGGRRVYPLGPVAAQLVGWTTDGRYAAGEGSIETACDSLLRGYRDEELPYLFRTRLNPFARKPRPADVETTIEARLQRRAHELLQAALRSSGGSGGAVVLYEADSGRVLAAATAPTFDPNELNVRRMRQYVRQHRQNGILFNKALARDARYFPGSAFKILTLAAGLMELPDGSVRCTGRNAQPLRWEYAGRAYSRPSGRIPDYTRAGHGTLSFPEDYAHALTRSCNVFFAALATRLGPERLRETMLAAELAQVPSERELADYLPEAGFGQVVVKVAPLELAQLAGAVGMEGLGDPVAAGVPRPYWLSAVIPQEGERLRPAQVYGAPDDRPYRPFPGPVAARLREAMLSVVNDPSGTAYAAFHPHGGAALPGIAIGGKTGTAEFDGRDARGRRRRGRHAWFIGFARSERDFQPKTLAVAVLLEDVGRGVTGGSAAAPVARDLLETAFGPWQPPAPIFQPPSQPEPWWRQWLRRLF